MATNEKGVVCPKCTSKIFLPNAALEVKKEMFLHKAYDKEAQEKKQEVGDNESVFWMVEDQFKFENIGVTKPVDVNYRYLVCADCDFGPLGITYTETPNVYYISSVRVAYT